MTLQQVCFTFSFTYPLYKHTDKHTHKKKKKLSNSLDLFFFYRFCMERQSAMSEKVTLARTHMRLTRHVATLLLTYIYIYIYIDR